jgi:hypothetical protein
VIQRSDYTKRKRRLRLLWFFPAAIVVMERLWIPFEFESQFNMQGLGNVAFKHADELRFKVKVPRLDRLTTSSILNTCGRKFQMIKDVHLSDALSTTTQKIPRIVHQTSTTRCLTPNFYDITNQWKFSGWAYYFHDDDAMERLLQIEFPEFAHLASVIRNCATNGTIKADVWRYLVLYVYGGIYADLDSAPTKFEPSMISPNDDGLFVLEQYHLLSQWFMAISPRHPLMYYAIQHSIMNLMDAADVQKIDASKVTGPHALHSALIDFVRDAGGFVESILPGVKPVKSGTYNGTNGKSIRVVGKGENQNEFVNRMTIHQRVREKDYRAMGLTHFSVFRKGKETGLSCKEAMRRETWRAIELSHT